MSRASAVMTVATPRYSFGKYDRLRIGDRAFVCVDTNTKGHVFERIDGPKLVETYSHEHVAVLLKAGALLRDANHFSPAADLAVTIADAASLANLSDKEQLEVLRRAEYVRRYEVAKGDEDLRARLRDAYRRENKLAPEAALPKDAELDELVMFVHREMQRVDFALAVSTLRKKRKSKRFGVATVDYQPVSGRTVRRWNKAYQDALDAEGGTQNSAILALRPRWRDCGDDAPRLDLEAYMFVRKYAVKYATRERPSVKKCHEMMETDLAAFNAERVLSGVKPIKLPSVNLLRAHVKSLDKFMVYAQRRTLEKARAKFGPIGQGPDAERPLQRVEIDGWEVHLKTLLVRAGVYDDLSEKQRAAVEKVRMVLSVAIDCATRCILAMRLTRTEDARAGVDLLAMALSDKTELARSVGALAPWHMTGDIEAGFVDNGYASRFYRNTAASVMVHASIVPAALPWLRPYIERLFRTFDLRLMPMFSGRTFSNVVDAEGYDSDKLASLTVEELADVLVRFVVDVYHLSPHEGLKGETPFDAWERMTKETAPRPAPDKHKFTAVFGIPYQPKLGRNGLRALTLDYQSEELQELVRRHGPGKISLQIRIHPKDASYAVVMIDGAWIRVTPTESGYEGVPVADVIAAIKLTNERAKDQAAAHRPTVLQALREIEQLGGAARRRAGIAEVSCSSAELAHATSMFAQTMHVSEPSESAFISSDAEPTGDFLAGVAEVTGEFSDEVRSGSPSKRSGKSRRRASPKSPKPSDVPQGANAVPTLRRRMGPMRREGSEGSEGGEDR